MGVSRYGPGFWEFVIDENEVVVVLYNSSVWILFGMLDVDS